MLSEGLYDALASGNKSVVTKDTVEYVFEFQDYVKGINCKDKLAVSDGWIESKLLGRGKFVETRRRFLTPAERSIVTECMAIARAHPNAQNLNYSPGARIADDIAQKFGLF